MDTREEIYSGLEENVSGDEGLIVIPATLTGNIQPDEIRNYLSLKGYDCNLDRDRNSFYIRYVERKVSQNA